MINKILYILNNYNELKAKIWNIDTDTFNILNRLKQNIENNNITNFSKLVVEKNIHKNEKNNDLFFLKINNINITPSKNNGPVATSTIRQYLQLLSTLNCINYDNDKHFNKNNSTDFSLNFEFVNIINSSPIDHIYITIINSLKSSINYTINYGYSLFLCILLSTNKDILNQLPDEFILEKVRTKNNVDKFIKLNDYQSSCYIQKCINETYSNFVKEFNNKNIDLNKFINDIYSYINLNCILPYQTIDNQKELTIKNIHRVINNYRSNLRTNIIEERSNQDNFYTDIEYYDEEQNKWCELKWPQNQSEAAHINSVKNIKEEIKKKYSKQ